jgi:hypothetical protein
VVPRTGPSYAVRDVTPPPPKPVGPPEKDPTFPGYDIKTVNPRVQKILRVAAGFDDAVRTNGLAYTRYILGTTTYSQHSRWRNDDCLGNAADLIFPLPAPVGVDMARLDDLRVYLIEQAKKGYIELGYMVFKDRDYAPPNFIPQYYGGQYHTHLHIEALPSQSGSVC